MLTSVPYRLPQPGERAPGRGGFARAPERSRDAVAPAARVRELGVVVERAARDRAAPPPRLSSDAIWRTFEGFASSMASLAGVLVGLPILRDHLSVETVALWSPAAPDRGVSGRASRW